jgi:hypothetical protein
MCYNLFTGNSQCHDFYPVNFLTPGDCEGIAGHHAAPYIGSIDESSHPLGCIHIQNDAVGSYFYNSGSPAGSSSQLCDYNSDTTCVCDCNAPTAAPTYAPKSSHQNQTTAAPTKAPSTPPTFLNQVLVSQKQYQGCDYITVQLSTANAGYYSTDGGLATLNARAVYAQQNLTAAAYTGEEWPYVILPDLNINYSLVIDPNITANITIGSSLELRVNDQAVYQNIHDTSANSIYAVASTDFKLIDTSGALITTGCATESPSTDGGISTAGTSTMAPTMSATTNDNNRIIYAVSGTLVGVLALGLLTAFVIKPRGSKSDISNVDSSTEHQTLIRPKLNFRL